MHLDFRQLLVALLFCGILFSFRKFPRFWIITGTMLRRCWFVFFLGLVIWVFFAFTGQGRSIVQEIDFTNTTHRKYITLFVLWMWGFNSFLLAIYTLKYVNVEALASNDPKKTRKIKFLVPVICGLFPFLIAVSCFLAVRDSPDPGLLGLMLLDIWLFAIFLALWVNINGPPSERRILHIASAFIFYFCFLNEGISAEKNEGKNSPKRFFSSFPPRVLNWIAHGIICVVICIWPIQSARFFGPIGVVFIASSSLTIFAILIVKLRKWSIVPVLPILIVAILLFSAVSDNNRVAVLSKKDARKRPSVDEHFMKWILERNIGDTIPVTLVASEGGGLRSAFWTYATLRKLQETNPRFFRNLFAISSVSGGSIGSALFCAEHLEGYTPDMLQVPILNNDNLSPMLAALMFREFPQSLVPFDVFSFDRSTVMDETFDFYWRKVHRESSIMRSDFVSTWNRIDSLPSLFLNSIHVESGASAVLSNLSFDTTVIQSTDFLAYTNSPLSVSCATGLSARFPYLQPAAKYEREDGSTWGHLADGGYFENSGLAVAYQVYLHLKNISNGLVAQKKIKPVQFHIILIRNGQAPTGEVKGSFLSELNSPLSTLLNSWYTRGYSYSHLVKLAMGRTHTDKFYEIRLQKPEHEIPVGWFLSARSRMEIIRQAEELTEHQGFKEYNWRLRK